MKKNVIAALILLFVLWVWLCKAILTGPGGFSFKNVFLIVASGIIIFVPLWKKYFRRDSNQ